MSSQPVTPQVELYEESELAALVPDKPTLSRAAIAATVIGNALEFYDFLTYSFFAVYIGQAFFPSGNELASLLLSLATFGVGFVTRPLGAIVIGAYADRAGRRPALMLTIALMTTGTLALAATPSYATIGVAAPIILVIARLLQGLAIGGEIGPSTAVLLESAGKGRRGRLTSWQSASQGIAIITAGLVGLGLSSVLSKEQLADWGWRVPFALGLLIVPVGLYIRRNLPETLETSATQRNGFAVLGHLWSGHRRSMMLVFLIIMCLTITSYVQNFMTTYALTTLHLSPSLSMLATLVTGGVGIVMALISGRLSDRFGRKPLMIYPRILMVLIIYPAFQFLVSSPSAWSLCGVTALIGVLSSLSAVSAITALAEIFPNDVRSSGIAITYGIAVCVFGGTTQFILAWLIGVTGDPLSPAYYVIFTSAISLWAMYKLPETYDS